MSAEHEGRLCGQPEVGSGTFLRQKRSIVAADVTNPSERPPRSADRLRRSKQRFLQTKARSASVAIFQFATQNPRGIHCRKVYKGV
jgi:hypothetical protein